MADVPAKRDDTVNRRAFLVLASAAAAPAALVRAGESSAQDASPSTDTQKLEYRETPHISAFYKRCRY